MVQKDSKIMVPPKLLAGAVVLYWGAMVGLPFIALVMAIMLEAKNWVSYRWDISEKGYVKAFYVTLFLVAVTLLIIRLDDVDITSFSKMIRWSPIFALPIELAQRYGKSDRMFLNTFFYFSRQRMINDRKEGRQVIPNVINTGYPYLIGVLISATCTDRQDWLVSVGMLVIVLAILFSVIIERRMRWQRLIWVLPFLLGFTLAAQAIINDSYVKIVKIRTGAGNYKTSSSYDALSARLGALGQVKQSDDIQWRLWSDEAEEPPDYIHTGIYNKFDRMRWKYDYKSSKFESLADSFSKDGTGVKLTDSTDNAYVFKDSEIPKIAQARKAQDLSKIKIRGVGETKTSESIVPSILGFKVVSDLASSDTIPTINPMGVIKLVDREVIIDYQLWRTDSLEEIVSAPVENVDTLGDPEHTEVIKKLVEEIKLNEYPTTLEKVVAIRRLFTNKYQYALHFHSGDDYFSGSELERFIKHRKGHCEYFATTAALMLRQVGVPTRYVVGYVVREKDNDQWLIRGTHGHAWCHVWMDGEWQNVDLTPPDWLALEGVDKGFSWWQRFTDGFQRYREDFQVWKSQEGNEIVFNRLLIIVGGLLVIWFGIRIWRKRLGSNHSQIDNHFKDYEFSKEIEKIVKQWEENFGERPLAITLRQWFFNHSTHLSSSEQSNLKMVLNRHEKSRFGLENCNKN